MPNHLDQTTYAAGIGKGVVRTARAGLKVINDKTYYSRSLGLQRTQVRLLIFLLALALIYTLAIGQKVLLPTALAFLLSLVLAPFVRWLELLHIPRPIGAGLIVAGLVTGLGYGVTSSLTPISEWFESAPSILKQIEHKIRPIKETVQEVNRTTEQVDKLTSMERRNTVEIRTISFQDVLYTNAQGLVTGLVMSTLLLYFFLSWGRTILVRIGRLVDEKAPRHRFLELSTLLESEVSKYLFTITLINVGLGIVVAGALYLLGMPNPLLWGSIAALLNYIPYLGGLMTAALLGITALLSFPGLDQAALIVAVFTALNILEGQIVTPLILGKRLALNPLIVFLSIVFWFWLWGVMGAFMAVPMLITLKLIGDRVAAIKPLAVIAGR